MWPARGQVEVWNDRPMFELRRVGQVRLDQRLGCRELADSLAGMSSRGGLFACFGDGTWPGVAEHGFEGTAGCVPLGRLPTGAGVEAGFWDAVQLQTRGGGRNRWKPRDDFYAHVHRDGPAFDRVNCDVAEAEPFWLGLHPFSGTPSLYVTSARVERAEPIHRFAPHPGAIVSDDMTVLGFRLSLATDGTYFETARR